MLKVIHCCALNDIFFGGVMEELLTDEFVRAFYKKMQSCGYPNADKIGWAMGTNNWANSIRESCLELNLKEL